jgi:hypothetical protein
LESGSMLHGEDSNTDALRSDRRTSVFSAPVPGTRFLKCLPLTATEYPALLYYGDLTHKPSCVISSIRMMETPSLSTLTPIKSSAGLNIFN